MMIAIIIVWIVTIDENMLKYQPSSCETIIIRVRSLTRRTYFYLWKDHFGWQIEQNICFMTQPELLLATKL